MVDKNITPPFGERNSFEREVPSGNMPIISLAKSAFFEDLIVDGARRILFAGMNP